MADERIFTHKELVEAAYVWALNNGDCAVAFKELNVTTGNGECPDVIGFSKWEDSTVIECKVSRADFHSDKKKSFRSDPQKGMGKYRYFCCPTGLIKKDELPDGWGLIYVNAKGGARYVWGSKKHESNLQAERCFMVGVIRRCHLNGVLDCVYNKNYSGVF